MLTGIIDIGSNTIRLAVYEIWNGKITLLAKKKHLFGLAAYIDDGCLSQFGIDMAAEAIREYRVWLKVLKVDNDVAYATGALRNVANSRAAVAALEEKSGVHIRILSGEEEATFAFTGLMYDAAADSGLVADIGGASTELIYFRERKIEQKVSLPIGSLAMYKECVGGLLPTARERAAIEAKAAELIREADFAAPPNVRLCGIGGTFKSALALGNAYFRLETDNKLLTWEQAQTLRRRFAEDGDYSQRDAVALLQAVPDRLHVLFPGLSIAAAVVRAFGCEEIMYSDSGVREGFLRAEVLQRN